MRIAVVGAGSWGTTVAAMVAPRAETTLWARRPELATAIDDDHENPDYLPGNTLPTELAATADLPAALEGAAAVIMGVPSHGYRAVLEQAAPLIPDDVPIVSLTKGIEQATLMRMTQVTEDVLPDHRPERIGVADRTQPRQGGHRRPAGGHGRGHAGRGRGPGAPGALHGPDVSGVHQPRCCRLRVGGSAEERHGDRRRDGGRSGLRAEHPGHPDHPRPGRDDSARGRPWVVSRSPSPGLPAWATSSPPA